MEKQLVIQSQNGLHARPAGIFAKKAMEFKSSITIRSERGAANAKSILAVMGLGLDQGSQVTLVAEGEDAMMALSSLEQLLSGTQEH